MDIPIKQPSSFKISRQLDQEKIDFLSARVDGLLASNNEMRTNTNRHERDTNDIVLYFQREIELKDDVISRLNEELVKRETQLKHEFEKMKKRFEVDLETIKKDSMYKIQDLQNSLNINSSQLRDVISYKEEKEVYDAKVVALETKIEQQKSQLFDALETQERKFLANKAHMIQDYEDQMGSFRDIAVRDARKNMGMEAVKLLASNNAQYDELKFLHILTSELQTDKIKLEEALKVATRDVTLLNAKEEEYAKQACIKGKEIKRLRETVEFLEKKQVVNIERYKQKSNDLKSSVQQQLFDVQVEAESLRHLLSIKNKELRKMQSLANTILKKRSDVEQFLACAIEEVRDVLKKEREIEASKQKVEYKGRGNSAGALGDIQIPSRPLVGALRPQHGKKQRPLSGPSHLSGGSRIAAMKPRASSAGPIRNTSNRNPLLYKPIPMHDQRNADGDEAIATAEEDGVVYDTNTTFPSIQIEAQKLAHHRRSSIKGVRGGENTSVAADDFHGKSSKSYDALAKNEVEIRDMTWEDKELVIRVLFSKINEFSGPRTGSALQLNHVLEDELADGDEAEEVDHVFISDEHDEAYL